MGARTAVPLLYAGRQIAARMARGYVPAAIRVPARSRGQLRLVFPSASPSIFIHEGARQSLERKLRGAFPGPVILTITDNRHSIITHRIQRGVLHARIHHMFLDAPPAVVDALVQYVTHNDRAASALLGGYIDENGFRLAKRKRNAPLVTKGKHHDLLAIYEQLNERYFDGAVNAVITWGKAPTTKARHRRSIKMGSYAGFERVIRIHPALDRKWVPRYFVAFVVYHEMLHHVIPASRGLGRTNLHPPEFRAREKECRHYERSLAWEKKHIDRLLRS